MESVLAIGVGLAVRVVVDVATDNDNRMGGVLVGLWEGVVLNHFVRKMPRSFDPYIALGFRVFVDFMFTQSLSRLALVALWTLVGMLLADVAPSVWYDSGLRRIYRHVRRDVRHIKRAVPDIRIKNDIPSVRLFGPGRTTSTVSGSIRSDRAAPAQSPPPPPAPLPGPPRRTGRTPPGTFPGTSGWSETETEVTALRERIVMSPGPSPALIPSRVDADVLEYIDTTHVRTPQAQAASLLHTQDRSVLLETAVTTTDHVDDPSRLDPPMIPDDWVTVTPPLRAQSNTPKLEIVQEPPVEPTPSFDTQTPRPDSVVIPTPTRIDTLPDIPDIDLGTSDRRSRAPHQIPLPESRAASVIGGVYDQPRTKWRENVLAQVDKASSDLGVDPSRPYAPFIATQTPASHNRTGSTASAVWPQSKLKHLVEGEMTEPALNVETRKTESVVEGKDTEKATKDATQDPEFPTCTPTQVDPPSDANLTPVDVPKGPAAEVKQSTPLTTSQLEGDIDAGTTVPQGSSAGANGPSYLDPDPTRTPPPPFTEFAGVPGGEDLATQDDQPTELSEEQKVAEEKRIAFLMKEVEKKQAERDRLQEELAKPKKPAETKSKLDEIEKTLTALKGRISKKRFSDAPVQTEAIEIDTSLLKSKQDVIERIASTIQDCLLRNDHAGPILVQASLPKGRNSKADVYRNAIKAFANENKFVFSSKNNAVSVTV